MEIKKGDFIELEFTGKIDNANGEIFDTTNSEIAKKLGYKREVKPIRIIVGEGMIIDGLDKALEGKEIGKQYSIEIMPNEAFGERKRELIKIVPANAFKDKSLLREGNTLVIDGFLARIVKVGSGRVLLDLNHPLAGKKLYYEFKILKKIENEEEKLKVILEYFGIKDYKIEKKDGKLILKIKKLDKTIEALIKKYIKIEITNLE